MSARSVSVCKVFTFHAAHHDEEATDKCARMHGHTYRLEIEACGELGKDERMLLHGNVLKDIYAGSIEPLVEHQNLNETCPYNPTMENTLMWLADIVSAALKAVRGVTQCRLRLWETPTMYAETRRNTF